MLQELIQNTETQWLAIISMMIFLSFFVGMAIIVWRSDPEKAISYSKLPLDDETDGKE